MSPTPWDPSREDRFANQWPIIRMNALKHDIERNKFFTGALTPNAAHAIVHAHQFRDWIEAPETHAGDIQRKIELSFVPNQLLFGHLAFSDVEIHADPLVDFTVRVQKRRSMRLSPYPTARDTAQAILGSEMLLGCNALLPMRDHGRLVIWMDRVNPVLWRLIDGVWQI